MVEEACARLEAARDTGSGAGLEAAGDTGSGAGLEAARDTGSSARNLEEELCSVEGQACLRGGGQRLR